MSLISTTLDALEDYLNEYQYLHNSFNKAYLLLTRFKLNYGQDGIELLLHKMIGGDFGGDVGVGDCNETGTIVRNRKLEQKNNTEPETNTPPPSILTKQDHINSLKTNFHSLLHTKIIPLAKLKLKLANDLRLMGDECK